MLCFLRISVFLDRWSGQANYLRNLFGFFVTFSLFCNIFQFKWFIRNKINILAQKQTFKVNVGCSLSPQVFSQFWLLQPWTMARLFMEHMPTVLAYWFKSVCQTISFHHVCQQMANRYIIFQEKGTKHSCSVSVTDSVIMVASGRLKFASTFLS